MGKSFIILVLVIILFTTPYHNAFQAHVVYREIITIEDFDDGNIELSSYQDEDIQPDHWELSDENTYHNSPFALKLYGNTWKTLEIEPTQIDQEEVWQIATYEQSCGEIHGLGLSDGENYLFYSFSGTEELDIEEWIPVYQGAFADGQWNSIELPIADDWYAWYEYYPLINQLIFVNDADDVSPGTYYFDNVIIISNNIPTSPQFEITFTMLEDFLDPEGQRSILVGFQAIIEDPLPDEYYYYWDFGDGETSNLASPVHVYQVQDDHQYTIFLEITNEKGYYGLNSIKFNLEQGNSTLPVTMNFVGDIMLARGYEENGGIIQTQGVEAIFTPTLSVLGDAADVTVANLECPLTTHNIHHPTKTIYFKGNPENIAGLTYAGIDVVTLANNHILDYNYPGLSETQSVLSNNGILHSGAGIDSYEAYEPIFLGSSGLTFAYLASSDRTGQYNNYQPYLNAGYNKPGFAYMTPYYIQQQIEEVQDVADFVIVEMHAGSEYSTEPGNDYDFIDPDDPYPEEEYFPDIDIPHMWDIEIRHHAVDVGADLVIVHHPHIIQGLELYNGKLIAHSLGNFAFDLKYPETMSSMILNTKINETGFYHFDITPVFIDDWIPQPAVGELGLYILDYIARRSRELGTYVAVDRENITANVIMDSLTMTLYENDYQINSPIQMDFPYSVSQPINLVRDGNISNLNAISPESDWEYRLGSETIWFGNFEDEGCSLWNLNSNDEWYDEDEAYEGLRSLCHRRYPNSGDNIITNLEYRLKRYYDNYTLQGYLKTSNGANVTIEIRYYESRYQSWYISSENIGIELDGDNDWAYFYSDLDLPENTNYFDIRCNSDCPESGIAYSWFDNVGLTAWTNWEEFNPGTEIVFPNDFYQIQFRTSDMITECLLDYCETSIEIPILRENSKKNPAVPATVKLYQNYPNPFNFSNNGSDRSIGTIISYHISKTSKVKLDIFNLKGQLVKTLINEIKVPGFYQESWKGIDENGKMVSSGIYFYRIKADKEELIKKCVLLK